MLESIFPHLVPAIPYVSRPLCLVKISERDLFLNFFILFLYSFFISFSHVHSHSPTTLVLRSEVSKEAEGRSANPEGQSTLFTPSSPLAKDWEQPSFSMPNNELSSTVGQTNTHTKSSVLRGSRLLLCWINTSHGHI